MGRNGQCHGDSEKRNISGSRGKGGWMTSREFFQWSGGEGVNVAQTIRWTVGAVFLMQNAMTAKLESGVAPCVRIISGSKDISFPEPDASTPSLVPSLTLLNGILIYCRGT